MRGIGAARNLLHDRKARRAAVAGRIIRCRGWGAPAQRGKIPIPQAPAQLTAGAVKPDLHCPRPVGREPRVRRVLMAHRHSRRVPEPGSLC